MRRTLMVTALLAAAAGRPAFAQSVPDKGMFSAGAFLFGDPTSNAAGIATGLNLSYLFQDNVRGGGSFALSSVDGVGTKFSFSAGAAYYPVKNRRAGYALFVGGDLGLIITSQSAPPGGTSASETQVAFRVRGGPEYYFSRHFGAQLAEGIQLITNPTSFALVSELGLNWYF